MSKPRARTNTQATATVTIKLHDLGSWGPDCKLDQVYDQARQAALGQIRRAFDGHKITIVGNPTISAITTDMDTK